MQESKIYPSFFTKKWVLLSILNETHFFYSFLSIFSPVQNSAFAQSPEKSHLLRTIIVLNCYCVNAKLLIFNFWGKFAEKYQKVYYFEKTSIFFQFRVNRVFPKRPLFDPNKNRPKTDLMTFVQNVSNWVICTYLSGKHPDPSAKIALLKDLLRLQRTKVFE